MLKRFMLFFGVNILVLVTVSLLLNLLGLSGYHLAGGGIDMNALLGFCFAWGMVGSFISLMLSKWMAKNFFGLQMVDAHGPYRDLVAMVHQYAKRSGLEKMPEVAIYDSPELNAFATGPSRNNALVAVSTGLLRRMSREEVEGVVGHEVAHIANGDMVTMALLQGVLNAFVMFFARIVAFAIDQMLRGNNENSRGLGHFAHYLIVMVLEIVFGVFASMALAWFSRQREFRADAGGAQLAGRHNMVAALEALRRNYDELEPASARGSFQNMQISSKRSMMDLFSSHPSLEKRIAALQGRKMS